MVETGKEASGSGTELVKLEVEGETMLGVLATLEALTWRLA